MTSCPSSNFSHSTTNTSNRNYPTTRTCHRSNQHISHSSNTFQVCTGCLHFAIGRNTHALEGNVLIILHGDRLTNAEGCVSWIYLPCRKECHTTWKLHSTAVGGTREELPAHSSVHFIYAQRRFQSSGWARSWSK